MRWKHPLRIVFYCESPLAVRYLTGLLPGTQTSNLALRATGDEIVRTHGSGFILVAEEGSQETAKHKLLSLVSELRENARTLVIGDVTSPLYLRHLFLAGIHGFIDYADLESQFRPALAAIRDGRLWMPVQTAEGFSPWLEDKARMGFASPGVLTPQEVKILSLLSRNLSNKEIGHRLRISERTVKFHLTNMFDKLGVRSRHALARFADVFAGSNGTDEQAVGSEVITLAS
jgi:DNA-binding NarL/FixJ family response regulator